MGRRVKLRSVGDSLVVTIPRSIADALGWERGDQIEIEITGPRSVALKK
ncbi:MAG: AbrB/MazE/SpoVT family DNA-binding domain-containing protein [Candidatus Syntropharchaeia archaeon]